MSLWVFSDACTSYLGAYGIALSRCEGGGAGLLEATVFLPTSGDNPPLCTSSAYATFAAPPGACTATAGTAAGFGKSFIFGGDGGPVACATSPSASAIHIRYDSTSCPAPTAGFVTMPTVAGSADCSQKGFAGSLDSNVYFLASQEVRATFFSPPGTSCAASALLSFFPSLPLTGVCTRSAEPPSVASYYAEALPLVPYTPRPPAPPPALPGTGALLLLWLNKSDCSGPHNSALATYTGECTAYYAYGVRMGACTADASVTVTLYNDTARDREARSPPTCSPGQGVITSEFTARVDECVEVLREEGGPGRAMGKLVSARCLPTAPDTVFITANFFPPAPSAADSTLCGGAPLWGTVEVLPCAMYNYLGLTVYNSSTAFAGGALSQTAHYSFGGGEGCSGIEVFNFQDVPVDGSACVENSGSAGTTYGMQAIRPGGVLPPAISATLTATASPVATPSASATSPPTPSATESSGASASPSPTETPTPAASSSAGDSASQSPTESPTPTASNSAGASASQSPTETPTPTASSASSPSESTSTSITPSPLDSPGSSPSCSGSPRTATPSASPSAPSISASRSPPATPGGGGGGSATGAGALSPAAAGGLSFAILLVAAAAGAWCYLTRHNGARKFRARHFQAVKAARAGSAAAAHPVFFKPAGGGGQVIVASPLFAAPGAGADSLGPQLRKGAAV